MASSMGDLWPVPALCLALTLSSLTTLPAPTAATTRYIPSPSSSSPWLSLSSSLYKPSSPNLNHPHPHPAHTQPSSSSSSSSSETSSPEGRKRAPSPPAAKVSSERAAKALHRDLSRLSRLLPGVYTNMEQYRREADDEQVPREKRHVLLRSSFRPVQLRFLPRAFCVLVQDYSGDSLFPFRQRVYTFSVDLGHRAIRMKVWNFATKRLEKRATQNLRAFHRLRRKDLVSQGSCDMFWRRLDRTTFMGITGKQCLGYVKGEEVRITVSMTLTSQLLQTNEGWYRARDGKTLVEVDIPYNLLRTKGLPDTRKKNKGRKLIARWRQAHHNSTQNDLPPPPISSRSNNNNNKGHDKLEIFPRSLPSSPSSGQLGKNPDSKRPVKKASRGTALNEKEREEKHKEWILSDFGEIAKALHSGHLVFYSVELSACTLPAQMKAERLSFGDFVDSFQSTHRSAKKDKATIRFWQSKFVQGDEGMEEITREITIHNNGRVLVRLLRKWTDTGKLAWDHTATCRLYEPESGLGGVKMTTRPAAEMHEITTFGRFRAALRRGRRQVRMIIDLQHCDGRTRGTGSIMGTTVRAYDFINQGKAVEVSQLTPDADHTHNSLLTGQFLSNGEVIFITSLQPHSGKKMRRRLPLFYRDSTYRCALSGSDVNNNGGGPWGVRLFYTT
ncbi:uncharacterized protein LOC143285892 [Babylonia areolata]|uniref:uncharacterized protein LOC143285892 n=1 Tax=Babylonia areolata TaxID=304850 RepID=UPI003FD28DEE